MANFARNTEPTQSTPATYFAATGAGSNADPYVPAMTAREPVVVVQVGPPLDTAIYGNGDLLFDSVAMSNVATANGGSVILDSITAIDTSDIGAAITLIIADSMVDFGTVNSVPTVSASDMLKVVASVAIASGDWVDLGSSRVACKGNLNIGIKCTGASNALALAAITAGTPTFAASALTFKLAFRQA